MIGPTFFSKSGLDGKACMANVAAFRMYQGWNSARVSLYEHWHVVQVFNVSSDSLRRLRNNLMKSEKYNKKIFENIIIIHNTLLKSS